MNYVKKIMIRNPKASELQVEAIFKSGNKKNFVSSEKEFWIKRESMAGKMLICDPVESIKLIAEEWKFKETYEMDDASGIEIRYYNIQPDPNGQVYVLQGGT